jgi:hypothetical protein
MAASRIRKAVAQREVRHARWNDAKILSTRNLHSITEPSSGGRARTWRKCGSEAERVLQICQRIVPCWKNGIKEVDDGIWLASFMRYDPGYFDLDGAENPATLRQPVRHKVVTYVSGTTCYLCFRAGQAKDGGPRPTMMRTMSTL